MTLRERLAAPGIVLAPGVYDAFTAMLAERAGFEALYLSGASVAYTRLGRPDIGLVTETELEETLSRITERVARPVIVDADTGFGNALNVQRTVKRLERAGAAAIQLEDQVLPKRCGHLDGKQLVSAAEMAGKVKAALDARASADTLIVARTDAVAVEGLEPALDRAEALSRSRRRRALRRGAALAGRHADRDGALRRPGTAPRQHGRGRQDADPAAAPSSSASASRVAIFPGGTARAAAFAFAEYFASLKAHGTTAPYRGRMLDFDELQRLLGTADMLALGRRYDDSNAG